MLAGLRGVMYCCAVLWPAAPSGDAALQHQHAKEMLQLTEWMAAVGQGDKEMLVSIWGYGERVTASSLKAWAQGVVNECICVQRGCSHSSCMVRVA